MISSLASGTVKMGNVSDPTTVVDPQLRIKEIKNLRVADCSVMQIVPSGDTKAPAASELRYFHVFRLCWGRKRPI